MAAAGSAHCHAHTSSSLPFVTQDDGVISDQKESRILEVLQKIRKKDPAVFDPTVKFFSDSDEEEEEQDPGEPFSLLCSSAWICMHERHGTGVVNLSFFAEVGGLWGPLQEDLSSKTA